MNKIFFHVYVKKEWLSIYTYIMNSIFSSDLINNAELHICVVGNFGQFNKSNTFRHKNMTVKNVSNSLKSNEWSTIKHLYTLSNDDDNILYIHTKGVITNNINTKHWREYLVYFNITKWIECVSLLMTYDACGVELVHNTEKNISLTSIPIHYSYDFFAGNFWWATGKYLFMLPHPNKMKTNYRWSAERWIGMKKDSKLYSFHQSGIDLYKNKVLKSTYVE